MLFFSLFLFTQSLFAQEEGASSWKIKGFLDTYHALQVKSPNKILSSRTRLRTEIEKTFGSSSIFVSLNATYNPIIKEKNGVELREAYIDHREETWGFRLGRQLVIWGVADGLRITDLVSPIDMSEFLAQDYDDIRIPVNSLRFFTYNNNMRLELIITPKIQGYILPINTDNPWSLMTKSNTILPLEWDEKANKIPFRLRDIEYGGRLTVNLEGIDFSLSGLHTWNKIPILTHIPSHNKITVLPKYYRMGFIGGDFSKPINQFVIRGEAAFNFSKHFNYINQVANTQQKGFNTANWLLGIDWFAPNEWTVMVQFSNERIFDYKSYILQPKSSSLTTLNISKKLLDSNLQISDFTYYDINNKGWFSRISADYSINDNIHIIAGFDWFGGDKGMFGTYKDNSEVWIKAKYSF